MLVCLGFVSTIVLICFTSIHFVTGVQINSIGLDSGLPYVGNREAALIKFNVTLEDDEILQSVSWDVNDGAGHYEWTRNGTHQVSGILSGALNTSVENGELFFSSAKVTNAGNYTLTVTTNLGTDTANYTFIVFYYPGSVSGADIPSSQKPDCKWEIFLFIPAVAPYPNISCVFDGDDGTLVPLATLTNFEEIITDFKNGTFGYEMFAGVPIQDIPLESFYACDFWIQDTKHFVLRRKDFKVSGKTCPEPQQMDNLTYTMVSGEEACRGGYTVTTNMNYSCTEDPKLAPQKTVKCERGGKWIEVDKIPWPNCDSSDSSGTSSHSSGVVFCAMRFLHMLTFCATILITSRIMHSHENE
ncbi:uncharacterized protein [Periplaneta americana]|uniref:uncharacterized protein isoform X2 n=1 Tax=Periplaneta americana TaxID=6978 RepID=UPI0037E96784